jgi:hypothetical protein
MGIADSLLDAYRGFKDGKKMFESGKTAGALVRAYVDPNGRQQNAALTQTEAWQVFYRFFGYRMKSIKPSRLQNSHCKLAERTLIDAWKAYEELNIVEAIFKMAASPTAKMEPLGVGNILMRLATVYLEADKRPSRAEIDEFDRRGGLIRQQIEYNADLYLVDLIAELD